MKGYRCYNLETENVYTSRHVTFVEDEFPYLKFNHTASQAFTTKSSLGSFFNPTALDIFPLII